MITVVLINIIYWEFTDMDFPRRQLMKAYGHTPTQSVNRSRASTRTEKAPNKRNIRIEGY